jgi:hypothetical protein
MTSKSLWVDIAVAADAEALKDVADCGVAVMASGIAGISTAYWLCTTSSIRQVVPFLFVHAGCFAAIRSGVTWHANAICVV